MKKHATLSVFWFLVQLTIGGQNLLCAQNGSSNVPLACISWPASGDTFSIYTFIKIKAVAAGQDTLIARVEFFADTGLIGVVTNSPFNLVWQVAGNASGLWTLKAVAVDNQDARTESAPVQIGFYRGMPTVPVLQLVSPSAGTLFAPPATFVFSAELLASIGDNGPVEFFVDTNSIGIVTQAGPFTATAPFSAVTVTNLPEGEYSLSVRYRGANGPGWVPSRSIRVTNLGVAFPRVTPDCHFQFDVVTAFPGRQTIMEVSLNLSEWTPISTNQPSGNMFTFTGSSPVADRPRFYRVVVLTQ